QSFPASKSTDESLIRSFAWCLTPYRRASAPCLLGHAHASLELFRRNAKPHRAMSKGSVEHQGPGPFGGGRSEQNTHRTAFRHSEESGLLRSDCIHNRADIIHSFFQRWYANCAIG